jgi:hypothetical protein
VIEIDDPATEQVVHELAALLGESAEEAIRLAAERALRIRKAEWESSQGGQNGG